MLTENTCFKESRFFNICRKLLKDKEINFQQRGV